MVLLSSRSVAWLSHSVFYNPLTLLILVLKCSSGGGKPAVTHQVALHNRVLTILYTKAPV